MVGCTASAAIAEVVVENEIAAIRKRRMKSPFTILQDDRCERRFDLIKSVKFHSQIQHFSRSLQPDSINEAKIKLRLVAFSSP